MKYSEDIQKLVIARLRSLPQNVCFSVGGTGDYTRDELIQEVKHGSPVGVETVEMQLQVLRKMPILAAELAR